ncbi:actin-like protein 7B [Ambystoma mexicanum]|uniref:actin-like protein 7B n=1 Tax=Ambystoma mexicanum TaxID=8296 RepID=UPI0037E9A110
MSTRRPGGTIPTPIVPSNQKTARRAVNATPIAAPQQGLANKSLLVKGDVKPKDSSTSISTPAKSEHRIVKETRAIIIDLGTGYCKAGYAGQQRPSCVISSTVGKHLQETAKTGDNRKESFIGQELQDAKIPLKLVNPLRHGIIVDWDIVQDIWEYIFLAELKLPPEEHAVMVSDPPLSPMTNREKYAEMMFETFYTPAMHIAYQSRLSMYSYGKTSGLVVECGHGVSHAVPIHEGYTLPNITGRVDYAGDDITRYLIKLLNESGNNFKQEHVHLIEEMKNKCCYVSSELDYEMGLPISEYMVDYELPDGQCITLGKQRFLCSEALFKPSIIGLNQPGLHTLTMSSLNKCDTTLKKNMMNNVLLCGGSTMMEGFQERFQRELNKLYPHEKPQLSFSPDRRFSVWTGGSILASLKSFQQLWVYKKEYDERGASVIYKKCF